MKYVVIAFASFIILSSHAQNRKIGYRHDDFLNGQWQGIDSIIYDYNAAANLTWLYALKGDNQLQWNPSQRVTYTYNANQNLTEKIREKGVGATWALDNKYAYSYDGLGNNTQIDYSVWNGSTWANAGKIMYTGYNANGKYATITAQSWTGGTWMNTTRYDYTYVNGQYLTESEDQYIWDVATIAWKKYQRHYYNYIQDSLVSDIYLEPDTFGNWEKISRILRTFDLAIMKVSESKYQLYDSVGNPFNIDRTTYAYSATNKVIQTNFEEALGSLWVPTSRVTYIYDTNDSLKERFSQNNNNGWINNQRSTFSFVNGLLDEEKQYVGTGTSWNESKKINFNYNGSDSLIYRLEQTYNNGNYTPFKQEFFYYNLYPLSTSSLESGNIKVYPNPTISNLYVDLEAMKANNATLTILDMYGRKRVVMQTPLQAGNNHCSLRTEQLEPGLYLLQITTPDEKRLGSFLKN